MKFEVVNFCEIDESAERSYCSIHNVSSQKNLGDITKVDETLLEDFNVMTWGFPCTDISIAGEMKGMIDEDGNKTRSGLYYDGLRILKEKKPVLSIIENVKNLLSIKFKKEFETIISDLDEAGYNSYYKILNSLDYGVPQHRERVFIVSIRKDFDNKTFKFPAPTNNTPLLKDILDVSVDSKFKLSTKAIAYMDRLRNGRPRWDYHKNIYEEIAHTLTANMWKGIPYGVIRSLNNTIEPRRLTPNECFRLMGFDDSDYINAKKVNKDTQLYKQCGNSVVVSVAYNIFVELKKSNPIIFEDLKLISLFSGIGAFEKALDKLYKE